VTLHRASSANPPVTHQPYDTTFADAGTGPYSLNIGAPTDPDGGTLVVTIDTVPAYGITEYFDGSSFNQLHGGETLTPAELATLQYTPDGTGTHGGGVLSYHVSDGGNAVANAMTINDVGEEDPFFGAPFPVLLFSAIGPAPESGPDLYIGDPFGDASSFPLRYDPSDPSTYTGSNAGEDGGFVHFASNVLFFADVPDGLGGVTLGQLIAFDDAGPFPVNGVTSAPGLDAHFTVFDGSLYFDGSYNGDSGQLIKIDANGNPSTIVLDPGHLAFPAGDYGGFTEMGGSLYLAAIDPSNGNTSQNPDLIRVDGNDAVTVMSTRSDPANGSDAGADGGIFAYGNTVYFNAFDDTLGQETLFKLDAGSTTPVAVDPAGTVLNHQPGAYTTAFHIYDGNLYFNEFQAGGNDTLFRMTPDGTITPLAYNGDPLVGAGTNGYGDLDGSLYFSASTPGTGAELFKLDADGTLTAIDIRPGPGDSFAGELGGFAAFAGALYFFADDPNNFGATTLFRLPEGSLTPVPVDGGSEGASGTSYLSAGTDAHFFQYGDSLVLQAQTADGFELVQIMPDGSSFVTNINSDPSGSSFPGAVGGFATQGTTTLTGTNGNDILVGCDANDTLIGGPGDDLLQGREQNDILTGGDGADIFKFANIGNENVDLVTDYTYVAGPPGHLGDSIDVTDLLGSFDPGAGDQLPDFVRAVTFQTGLLIQVDQDGTGTGFTWEPVALLEGANTPGIDHVRVIAPDGVHVIDEVTDAAPTVALTAGATTADEQVATVIDGGLTVADSDNTLLASADVFINAGYAGSQDVLSYDAGVLAGTNITAHIGAGEIVFEGVDTVANYEAVLRTVTYEDQSDTPDTTDRGVEITVNDGTFDSAVATKTVHVVAVDDPAVAENDAFTTAANALLGSGDNLFNDNGSGPDHDPDGPAITVASVNGSAVDVGNQITLPSGAHLTVNSDGTFSYDPNHAFDDLAGTGFGASDTSRNDSFTYAVDGGSSATVTITVDGVDNAHSKYLGGPGNDVITGGSGNYFDLSQGGNDTVTGGAGNDGFYFGAAYTPSDHVDGGGGTNNQLGLQGDYSAGMVLSGSSLTNIQVVAMLPGFDYNFTTTDDLVPAGHTLTFWSTSMASGNHVSIDASAETDGSLRFFLGQGDDTAVGGAGGDLFYGGGGADHLTGGGGSDTFAYLSASDSKGTAYDTITDFTAGTDTFKLTGNPVTTIDTPVSGSLSTATLDADLATILGDGQAHELDDGHAVLVTASNAGPLHNHVFLVVGTSGAASGYVAGADYVFDVTGGNFAAFSTGDFIS
jgi:ELWxxDGT repeat protein/VCBS repeat-containing protein